MALLGHGIDECLLMARLGYLGSLKSKWKSSWNYVKIENIRKWKYDLKKKFQTKSLIYVRSAPGSQNETTLKLKLQGNENVI